MRSWCEERWVKKSNSPPFSSSRRYAVVWILGVILAINVGIGVVMYGTKTPPDPPRNYRQ